MSDLLRFIFTTQEPFQKLVTIPLNTSPSDSRQNANLSLCSVKRVESLYDDLNRLKQIEPAGYRANVDAWRNALLAASKAGVMPPEQGKAAKSHFVMATGDQLLNALDTRQFGLPQSLGLVLV
jgi:hypothetical protein